MKISIITPTCNSAATIGRTMASVAAQTYTNLEHIVIDNCSTDGTQELTQQLAGKYGLHTTIISEPDAGIYNAINKGIALATGHIVGVLHADDAYASPTVLAEIARRFADPACRMVYGDVSWRRRNRPDSIVRYFDASHFTPGMLLHAIAPPHPSLYIRRSTMLQAGPYRENYIIAADFEMFVRLMLVQGISAYYIPMEMVAMSAGGMSGAIYNRIITNTIEKRRALTDNGIHVTMPQILCRYIFNLMQYFNHVRYTF